jgi:hypothetical protein
MALQHLRSSTADKRPTPAAMSDGQLAMNTNLASPGLFLKDSNGDLVKVGPVHVGTTAPNATPGAGGQAGNSKGELWLDTTGSDYTLKTWDGIAWREIVVTSTMIKDGTIVNADVNASAAIAGTKISPDFGSQTVATTGIFSHALGTAGAPTITFTGDTNTGIFSPGADQVAISTNGTGRLFVDSAGNVGVGTGSPGQSLSIVAPSTAQAIGVWNRASDNTYGGIYFKTNDGATDQSVILNERAGTNGSNLAFYTKADGGSSTERFRITSAGLVGLGTSSPAGKLNVAGYSSTDIQQDIHITRSSSGTGIQTGPNLTLSTGTATDAIALQGTQGRFGIWNYASSSWVERFCVTGPGNVGIGTTSPSASLGFGTSVDTTPSDVSKIQLYNDAGLVYGFGVSANQLNYRAGTVGDAHVWHVGLSEKARIDGSGRLLVGTSSDSGGALLQVNDNRIRIATANTPASAGATGTTGEIAWDADYIYVCTATNTWKRTAISTW